jgi:hypothetical protein
MKKSATLVKEEDGRSQQDDSPNDAYRQASYTVFTNPEFASDEEVCTGGKHTDGDKNPRYE